MRFDQYVADHLYRDLEWDQEAYERIHATKVQQVQIQVFSVPVEAGDYSFHDRFPDQIDHDLDELGLAMSQDEIRTRELLRRIARRKKNRPVDWSYLGRCRCRKVKSITTK